MRAAIFIGCLSLLLARCASDSADLGNDTLSGTWTNRSDQTFIFNEDGTAQWIIISPHVNDTFQMKYQYDASRTPALINFSDFDKGTLVGYKLLGILQFEGNASFRFVCEMMKEDSRARGIRPQSLDVPHTVTYYRIGE